MDSDSSAPRRTDRLIAWAERYLRVDISYLLRSGLWLNLGSMTTIFFSFLLSIAFANLISKETYGTYQYLLSLFSIFTAFTLTGMNAAITRSVAQGREGVLRASIRPQLLWNSGAFVLMLLVSSYYLLHHDLRLGVGSLAIALSLPIISTFNSYGAYLIGKQAFRDYFLYTTGGNLLYYACIGVTLFLFPSVIALICVNLAATTAGAVGMYALTLRAYKPPKADDQEALGYGKHLSAMNLLSTLSGQADNLLVFHFLGPVPLAVYSIATLIPERLSGVLKNVTNALLPRFAEQPFERVRSDLLRKAFLFFCFVAILVAAYIVILPFFFRIFYPNYLGSVGYSQIFSLTLFSFVGNFVGAALLAHRKLKRLYVINVLIPIVQTTLQACGIIFGGLIGLVLARVASSFIFLIIIIPITLFERAPAEL